MVSMTNSDSKTIIEWSYTPANFFEEPSDFSINDGTVSIDNGLVKGIFDGSYYELKRDFRDKMHDELLGRFKAQQVMTQKIFDLSEGRMTRKWKNGRQDAIGFPDSLEIKMGVGNADFITKDKDGKIIRDSRKERLNEQVLFRERVAKLLPNSPTLRRLLDSYNNGLRDEKNILVHLYEISDLLKKYFFGKDKAINALNLSKTRWSNFDNITNGPYTQSRHRGKHDELKPITNEETRKIKEFSKLMIMRFVDYVERNEEK